MRRIVLGSVAHVPSLPEFVKLCRTVGNDDSMGDEPPTQQLISPPEDAPGTQFDNWGCAANRHLLAYILRAVKDRRAVVGTNVLVRFKNLWADQMRLSADPKGEVPIDEQQDVWAECMRRAEEEIAHAA